MTREFLNGRLGLFVLYSIKFMKLGLDLRFYSPSPYGLAILLKNYMQNVIPRLLADQKFTKIILFIDQKNEKQGIVIEDIFGYKNNLKKSRVEIIYTNFRHYSFSEQLGFCKLLYSLNLNLVYFFTPNYPILYLRPFVYQIMDTTLLTTKKRHSIQTIALKLCFTFGLGFCKKSAYLSADARSKTTEIFKFLGPILTKKINSGPVIHSGVTEFYLKTPKPTLEISNQFKEKFKITKPYFHFISVFRGYKNIINLVKAFEIINNQNGRGFQLVLAGNSDPKYPEIMKFIHNSNEFKAGNIIVPGGISDQDAVTLIDNSNGIIAPTLAEGFGLWMLEAANRNIPILCNNLPVFKEIIDESGVFYFDGKNVDSIVEIWQSFINSDTRSVLKKTEYAYLQSKNFSWDNSGDQIISAINQSIK